VEPLRRRRILSTFKLAGTPWPPLDEVADLFTLVAPAQVREWIRDITLELLLRRLHALNLFTEREFERSR
jgi:hypothetical protein